MTTVLLYINALILRQIGRAVEKMSQSIGYSTSSGSIWTPSENILLERAILMFPEETPDRWYKISNQIPGKSTIDVLEHYIRLIQDTDAIDFGAMDRYIPSMWDLEEVRAEEGSDSKEKKKGTSWTEEEHILFLQGLLKYGKGDWKNICRNYVTTKTPTQVASHAQKYFERQKLGNVEKKRKRSSIHDITINHIPSSHGSDAR